MNPKCQTRPGFDTFSAKSADLTGLKMRRITRAASFDHLVGACEERRGHSEAQRLRRNQVHDEIVTHRRRARYRDQTAIGSARESVDGLRQQAGAAVWSSNTNVEGRSFTLTWTRSMRLWNSATIRNLGASLSPLAGRGNVVSWQLPAMRRASSASDPQCRR